jgi:methyl-accepting chemotaxis protein
MSFWRDLLTLNPRRKTIMVQPWRQLRLPLMLLVVTGIFAAGFAANAYFAFERMATVVLEETGAPESWKAVLQAQTGSFLLVSAAIGILYVLTTVVLSVVEAHRMVGPTVAFRRHVEALKNGDFSSRVVLRKGDAFRELAHELNDLAELLELNDKSQTPSSMRDAISSWSPSRG